MGFNTSLCVCVCVCLILLGCLPLSLKKTRTFKKNLAVCIKHYSSRKLNQSSPTLSENPFVMPVG